MARNSEAILALACIGVFVSLWIEKGLGLVVTGFVPSPLEAIPRLYPDGSGNRDNDWGLGAGTAPGHDVLQDFHFRKKRGWFLIS
jgi:hypothetical protein